MLEIKERIFILVATVLIFLFFFPIELQKEKEFKILALNKVFHVDIYAIREDKCLLFENKWNPITVCWNYIIYHNL